MKTSRKSGIALIAMAGIPLAIVIASVIMSPWWTGNRIATERGLERPLVIAHRGASFYAPELTLPSFALARDIGADYVETDVQRTRDGVLINFHDDDLSRTTNVAAVFPGREKDPVGSFTWAELQRLDAGSWFNRENPDRAMKGFAGVKIPSFREYIAVLSTGRNRPGLMIEMKRPASYPGIEEEVCAALRAAGWLDASNRTVAIGPGKDGAGRVTVGLGERRVILQSFDAQSLARLKVLAPSIMRNYLVDVEDRDKAGSFAALLETARSLDAAIGPSGYLGYPWYVGPAHRAGRIVFVYTIDKTWHFMLFSFFGIDGMITNRCDSCLAFLGRAVYASPADLLKPYR
jgi:glycerophosphoryl diester phosphodiesterase